MKRFSLFCILALTTIHPVHSEIKHTGDEDVLSSVSQKLTQIDERLKDHRLFVAPAIFQWKELDQFQTDLMFVVAHDPNGPVAKDTPADLSPTYLTQKLKDSWSKLELNILEIEGLSKDPEWESLKAEMSQFFKYREEFLYQPARAMIKTGLLTDRMNKLKEAARLILKGSIDQKDLSLKVIDPYVEKLANELSVLNRSIQELEALKNPPPVEIPTIYKPVLYNELYVFASMIVMGTLFITFSALWLRKKLTKTPAEEKPIVSKSGFNYYEWLKRLETNLQALKSNEENMSEQYITLKGLATQLSEARKNLNFSDNQQDYYTSLEHLNAAAPKIEEHFEKTNLRKHSDATRRIISQIIQLCDAIENKKEMSFEDEKPKLRLIKLEQATHSKVA